VGFNMSWIFVDGIDQDALHEALDLAPTGETPDQDDLGTSRVPLAGVTVKSGWCAVFAKYALVMDLTTGTNPPRLMRLPAKSRAVMCVVLEHATISYASFWQGGRHTWEIRHDPRKGDEHLEASGDLPPEFAGFCDVAMDKQRAHKERRKPGEWRVDHVFDVPLVTAATITGYRHDRLVEDDFFRKPQTLVLTSGDVLTKLSQPPTWLQATDSIEYES
jgi:hypothetical protein